MLIRCRNMEEEIESEFSFWKTLISGSHPAMKNELLIWRVFCRFLMRDMTSLHFYLFCFQNSRVSDLRSVAHMFRRCTRQARCCPTKARQDRFTEEEHFDASERHR